MSCGTPPAGCNDTTNKLWYPECYASVPSSVTDWTEYIQCAINDARAQGSGAGKVVLGAKNISNYSLTNSIVVGDPTNAASLVTVTLQAQTQHGATLRVVESSNWANPATAVMLGNNCILDGVVLQGSRQSYNSGKSLNGAGGWGGIGEGWNWQIRSCLIDSFSQYGINFGDGRRNSTINACEIRNNGNSGVWMGGSSNSYNSVTNCDIHDNGADGIDNGNGSNCTISGNSCYGNGSGGFGGDNHGILLFASGAACSYNTVTSNTCYDNYGSGIKAYPDPNNTGALTGNKFDSNECYGNGGDGITVETGTNTLVTQNLLHDNSNCGLYGRPALFLGNSASNNTWCRNSAGNVDAPNWNLFSNHTC